MDDLKQRHQHDCRDLLKVGDLAVDSDLCKLWMIALSTMSLHTCATVESRRYATTNDAAALRLHRAKAYTICLVSQNLSTTSFQGTWPAAQDGALAAFQSVISTDEIYQHDGTEHFTVYFPFWLDKPLCWRCSGTVEAYFTFDTMLWTHFGFIRQWLPFSKSQRPYDCIYSATSKYRTSRVSNSWSWGWFMDDLKQRHQHDCRDLLKVGDLAVDSDLCKLWMIALSTMSLHTCATVESRRYATTNDAAALRLHRANAYTICLVSQNLSTTHWRPGFGPPVRMGSETQQLCEKLEARSFGSDIGSKAYITHATANVDA